MPKPRIIEEAQDFPVKPADISTVKPLWEAFGNQETETSAHYIVLLMQRKGDWLPFTHEEIEQIYNESGYRYFRFNHLIGEFNVPSIIAGNHRESLDVIVERDGKFFVTDEFVMRCYRSCPVPRRKSIPQPA